MDKHLMRKLLLSLVILLLITVGLTYVFYAYQITYFQHALLEETQDLAQGLIQLKISHLTTTRNHLFMYTVSSSMLYTLILWFLVILQNYDKRG